MSESQQLLEPLPLNYSLAKRKLRILIFWLLVVFDSFVLPIGLDYLTRTTTYAILLYSTHTVMFNSIATTVIDMGVN
ncbi:hypothetical protein N7465_009191 [Penicillium sp. CMV-2018d]|nr:hypothetical protein N7465_009191 [Penicillium sp. CMV-2018d]